MANVQILGGKKSQEMAETLWAMRDGHLPKFRRGDLVETLAVINGEVVPDQPGAGTIVSGRWNALFKEYSYRVRWPGDDTPAFLDEYGEDELILVQKGN